MQQVRGGTGRSASVHRDFLSKLHCIGLELVACARAFLCRKLEVTEILHVQGSFSSYAGQCAKYEVIGIGMRLIACVMLVDVAGVGCDDELPGSFLEEEQPAAGGSATYGSGCEGEQL